jgi:hypothetical protein
MDKQTEIEKFCNEAYGSMGDSTTANIMRRVIIEAIEKWEAREPEPIVQTQTSGPRCVVCGAFTTYKRVETHGMCMKCEGDARS